MTEATLEARDLTKVYPISSGQQVRALDGISFRVESGEIFGLIGADGAGKTTAFKIMAGVLEATSGEVRVLGGSPRENRRQVGYLTQPFSLYEDLSIDENLQYAAGLRELPPGDFQKNRSTYLGLFGLDQFGARLAGQLSGGMKQKLALSCALIFDPQILLLDEPTTGVDPVSRRDFWEALTKLSGEGITIIVATPYFDEAERCHRVALMETGKIFETDSPAEFRAKLGLTRLGVRTNDLARAEAALTSAETDEIGIQDVQRFGDRLDVMVSSADEAEHSIKQHLQEQDLEVQEIHSAPPTLENAFVSTLRRMRGRETLPEYPRLSSSPGPGGSGSVAVRADKLNKLFGSFQAVKDFSTEICHGEIYGLLGANGAGKTTAIKMICGLLKPSSGKVSLLGREKKLRGADLRSQIGYMSQKFTLYDDLTIQENLDFYAQLYGVPEKVRKRRKEWVLEISGLTGEAGMLTARLPGGWKQRVAFGAAVMHEPRLIFLDEPTSGVDPLARRLMWRMINELADHGAAILVVTHYLEEAEQCNRLGFMASGEIIAQGSPGDVKKKASGHLLEVITEAPRKALHILSDQFGSSRISLFGDRLHVVVDELSSGTEQVRESLQAEEITIESIDETDFTLEDVFILLMEERRQSAEAPAA